MKSRVTMCTVALLIAAACSRVEDPTAVKLDEIIRIKITGPTSIRADGVSTTTVQATIPREATSRNVKFTTTQGTFQSTGGKAEIVVMADDQGIAIATIIAGREAAMSNITAIAGSSIASLTLPQERAYAQILTAETTLARVPKDGTKTATITAILTRQSGLVTPGTAVTFVPSAGRVINVGTTDTNGRATAVFIGDTITSPIDVTIVVTTPTDAGTNLSTQLVVRVE